MALVDIIRKGVAIASKTTESLKVSVTLTPWIGDNGYGADDFGDAVTLQALVDPTKKLIRTANGQLAMTLASLTFLDPIADTTPNAGFTRAQPIDPRDVITLSDGSTAPIVQIGGFTDAGTNRGFIAQVTLGTIVRG